MYVLHTIDYLDPGADGIEVIWDMSNVEITSSNAIRVITPDESPYRSSFPNSNICYDFGGGNYLFSTKGEAFYSRDGGVANGVAIPQEDPQQTLRFPLSYGASYKDDFSSEFTIEKLQLNRAGSISAEVVAEGTLIMPYGVIEDVLKLRITEEFTDSYLILGDTATTSTTNTSYHFLKSGLGEVILTLASIESNSVKSTSYGTMLDREAAEHIIAQDAPVRAITLKFDSSNSLLSIQFVSEWQGEIEIQLKDIKGNNQVTESGLNVVPGPFETELDLAQLPDATYLLHLQMDGRETLLKVVKE